MANRKDFYFRQRVTQAELDAAFDGMEQADFAIVKDVLGSGFLITAPDPATVVEASPQDNTVLANRFLGYDQLGRRLSNDLSGFQGGVDLGGDAQAVDLTVDEVGASTTVVTPGNEKTISIFIEFNRNQTDPRIDGSGGTVFFEQAESIKFNVVQSPEAAVGTSVPPPLRPDQLLLADVVRIFGQTTFANADIDQSRRESFQLTLPHGSSHAENGTDPVPNAVAVAGQGGLLSGVDKIKLDGITFDAPTIAALFDNQAALFQPSNVLAPSATTLDVTAAMVGKSAGGSASVEGVVTQTGSPNNRVILQDSDGDSFTDTSSGRNDRVYGRLVVDNEGAPTTWTLQFYTLQEGVGETAFDMSPFSGQTIQWWVTETFSLENLPTFDKFFSVPSDQIAAEYPFPIGVEDSGGSPVGGGQFSHIKEGSNITFADDGSGRVTISGPSVTGTVPNGAVIAWWRPNTSDPVPSDYVFCDGSVISDGASPFNGQAAPDLRDRFIRCPTSLAGYGGPGAPTTGGSDTHGHSIAMNAHSHGLAGHVHSTADESAHTHAQTGSTGVAVAGGSGGVQFLAQPGVDHIHNLTGTTGAGVAHNHGNTGTPSVANTDNETSTGTAASASNIPAYAGLVYIMKIK